MIEAMARQVYRLPDLEAVARQACHSSGGPSFRLPAETVKTV